MDDHDALKTLYKENGTMCREYLDWRHRVILRWFVSLAAMFVLAKWLFDSDDTKHLIWIPLAGSAVMSAIFFFMDLGITSVLRINAELGSEIEKRLHTEFDGYYTRIGNMMRKSRTTNTFIWRIVYLSSILLFSGGALYFLVRPPLIAP